MLIVVMDSNGSPRVAPEGIAATLDTTPGRRREEFFVVFADKMLGPEIIHPENLNLPNAHFIWDCHHLLHDIWPKDFGGSWSGNLSNGMSSLLQANSEHDFELAVSNLEVTYRGNTNVLNTIHKWAALKKHYAKYILDDTLGTCGKISNNPAEQNHSSIISHLGGALYEEPGSEIKKLIIRQRDLENNRQQEKSHYQFMIPAEIEQDKIIKRDHELKTAKNTLERKSFDMWRGEYTSSKTYSIEINPYNGSRTFTNIAHPDSPRIVPANERCNCSMRKQHFLQCRHEILENGGRLCIDLIDRRHIFYKTLHTKVKRNSDILGNTFPQAGASFVDHIDDLSIDCTDDEFNHVQSSTSTHDDQETNIAFELFEYDEPTDVRKKSSKKISYKELKNVLDDFAQICISQGIEQQAYGCAVQLLNVVRTGGDLLEGNLEEIIQGYQNMFSSTQTQNVSFTLSQDGNYEKHCDNQSQLHDLHSNNFPSLPIIKHGSRTHETRLKPAREKAIKGNNTPRGCGFCHVVGHKINNCQKIGDYGVRLLNGSKSKKDEFKQLTSYLQSVNHNSTADHFSQWPNGNDSPLQDGVPKGAQHMVICGIYSYTSLNCPMVIVVGVQFLTCGGIPMTAYSLVPMSIAEVTKVLYTNFVAAKKCVIVCNVVYACVTNM